MGARESFSDKKKSGESREPFTVLKNSRGEFWGYSYFAPSAQYPVVGHALTSREGMTKNSTNHH